MVFHDYFINLSIFSLLVSTPLIIHSFSSHKPLKHVRILGGIYAGIVSIILMQFTLKYQGYAYDIRYVPVILSFVYLGPVPGLITAIMTLLVRVYVGGNLIPVIAGWGVIILAFLLLEPFIRQKHPIKRSIIYFTAYSAIYLTLIPLILNVVENNLLFHLEYLLFILAGLFIGSILIESQRKLYSLNQNITEMYRVVATYQQELVHTLEQFNGGIFKLKKIEDQFVFTFTEGHLFRRSENHPFGGKAGMPITEKLPDTQLDSILSYCQAAWDGEEVQFELDWTNETTILVSLRPINKDGKVHEIVGTGVDISEKKRMEKTLKESESMLRRSEKLSVVGELAAGIAHEIRNPLTTLKGFVQLMKQDNPKVSYMDLLFEELQRIELITNELLSLAKPQAVKLNKVNIVTLVHNTVEILTPQAIMNDIQIFTVSKHHPIYLMCEENQLKQAMINILKNAIEAMPDGGTIHVSIQANSLKEVHIIIRDEGCGIPEELLPRLGEPFYTLKEKGTGLGLMISQKIIKEHQGNFQIQSKVGEGTVVHIQLPLIEEPS